MRRPLGRDWTWTAAARVMSCKCSLLLGRAEQRGAVPNPTSRPSLQVPSSWGLGPDSTEGWRPWWTTAALPMGAQRWTSSLPRVASRARLVSLGRTRLLVVWTNLTVYDGLWTFASRSVRPRPEPWRHHRHNTLLTSQVAAPSGQAAPCHWAAGMFKDMPVSLPTRPPARIVVCGWSNSIFALAKSCQRGMRANSRENNCASLVNCLLTLVRDPRW